jgi:hypothetical protein
MLVKIILLKKLADNEKVMKCEKSGINCIYERWEGSIALTECVRYRHNGKVKSVKGPWPLGQISDISFFYDLVFPL